MVAKGTKASSRHVKSWRCSIHCSEVTATPNCPVFHLVKEKMVGLVLRGQNGIAHKFFQINHT